MNLPLNRWLLLLVVLLALGATAFRISTAPERIRQRQELAESVCKQKGWRWVQDPRGMLCLEPAGSAQ